MNPLLKAYRYYRKNHSFLWDKYIAHTLVGDDSGFNAMYAHIAEHCGVAASEFVLLVSKAYDRRTSRALK